MAQLRRKLVVVGDGACGKTSLLIAFSKKPFHESYIPTVFESYVVDVDVDGRALELAMWDTAGQEDYDRLRPLSYPDANVALICFSVEEGESFDNVLEKWAPEVAHYAPEAQVVLVACKTDLRGYGRGEMVTQEQGLRLAQKINAHRFMECSAKTGQGISELFDCATRTSLFKKKKVHRGCIFW